MSQSLHVREDCAGRWRRQLSAGDLVWSCTGCGATHADSPSVERAIYREAGLDLILDHLTRAGRRPLTRRPSVSRRKE